jgi:phosphopantetheinyl transferase
VDAPPISPWAPGPPTARATAGVVDIWRADLAAIGEGLEDLLCAAEYARAAEIVPERRRAEWTRSRGVLRALLARYLGADPRELRFVLGPHGKPSLHREAAGKATNPRGSTTDLRFNLSHSGNLALVAVTAGCEVGVDIERPRERHTAEFLRAWVAREAAVKCDGGGLLASSQGFRSPGLPEEGLRRKGSSPRADLWTAALDLGPHAVAAVAVEGGECRLALREWRD